MTLLLLLGCPPEKPVESVPSDTGDTSGSTTDTAPSLAGATATFVGAPSDAAGNNVAVLADVTGDDAADVAIAAYYGNRVCVFAGPVAGRQLLDDASTCIEGEDTYDFAGYTIGDAGDTTGDGVGDLLVGAIGNADNGINAGKVYLFAGPLPPGIVSAVSAHAAWIGETSGDYLGTATALVGDVNGDGADDLAIGAAANDSGGAGGGKVYLVPGPVVEGWSQSADLATTFVGLPLPPTVPPQPPHGSYGGGDALGDAIAGPGDIDGDGVDDLLLGGPGEWQFGLKSGKALVWYGPIAPGEYLASDADYIVYGGAPDMYFGSPVTSGGDLDGDGRGDLLVSADGYGAGSVFLIPGSAATGEAMALDVVFATFTGEDGLDQLGFSVAVAGDVDEDGTVDLVFGAPQNDRAGLDGGAAYVLPGPFGAGDHLVADGIALPGEVSADKAGYSVAGGQDLTGDAVDDVLVGAIYNDDGGGTSGKAYLVPGG